MTEKDIEALARHLAEKSNLNPDGKVLPHLEPIRSLAGLFRPVFDWEAPFPAWKLFIPVATDILQFLERRKATS